MFLRHFMSLALLGPMIAACSSNPVFPEHEELELVAEVTFSTDDLATLSEFTMTIHVEDQHGEHVTNMAEVRAEFRLHETEDWRGVEMQLQGQEYVGAETFYTSGEYDFRVIGIEAGHMEELVLYEVPDHMEVGRAHQELGGFRVEFETFPGRLHEGTEAAVRFWVMEAGEDGHAHGHMMAELVAEIHITDPSGAAEEHHPHEEEPGMYEAHHTMLEAGDAHFEIHFDGPDGAEHHAEFHVPVAHAP